MWAGEYIVAMRNWPQASFTPRIWAKPGAPIGLLKELTELNLVLLTRTISMPGVLLGVAVFGTND